MPKPGSGVMHGWMPPRRFLGAALGAGASSGAGAAALGGLTCTAGLVGLSSATAGSSAAAGTAPSRPIAPKMENRARARRTTPAESMASGHSTDRSGRRVFLPAPGMIAARHAQREGVHQSPVQPALRLLRE